MAKSVITNLVVMFCIVTASIALGFALAAPRSPPPIEDMPVYCGDTEMQERIRAIMFKALDDALTDHIHHTFGIWMKDDTGQPTRARRGVHQGIKAYIGSTNAVVAWKMPSCP